MWHWRRLIVPALVSCILLYAALLRLDALFKTYGPYQNPRWLAALQPAVRAAAATLTPDWQYRHIDEPYVGGDPINYLRFAREMRSFYAAHVREPGFPAATRLGLIAAGGEDVGVSVASIAFALLALVATYLLGRQIDSPAVGLGAAAALAIDRSAIAWSIAGWRDEMFAFFAVLSVWAWLRLSQQPTYRRAAVAGIVSGGALLTRITSFALLAPPIVLLIAQRDRARRLLPQTALATALMLAIVGPFLVNCFIATGDALYAINNHTDFYLKREGIPDPPPMSAVAYTMGKFERPLVAADTMIAGLFTYPFNNKWVGIDAWLPGLGRALSWLAIAGMIGWLWHRDGRFVLSTFLVSLVPFSATWTVRGGAEWRLTLFAYSFYLIAAFWLVAKIVRREIRWPGFRVGTQAALMIGAMALVALTWALVMPIAIARSSLARGERAVILAGQRDHLLLADGWSGLVVTENVTARFTTHPLATIRLPLPELRPYRIVLRLDPLHYAGAPPARAHIALNGHPVATLDLGWDPERVGQYTVVLPVTAVRRGVNQLTLRSETMVPVGRAGAAYPELPRDREVGVRLWYVLIEPS
jgi:4-amino-4-deoxy-L-arabinose transferase-like glycosyltransferase